MHTCESDGAWGQSFEVLKRGSLQLVVTEVLLDLSKVLSVKPGVCLALI